MEELRKRARIMAALREFFTTRGYLEVETPRLCATPIPEAHLDLFTTAWVAPGGEPEEYHLLPSPEYYLKQLLARGSGNIFEIARAFRNGESRGPHHNPEFTMVEWYTVDADGDDSLAITEDLLRALREDRRILTLTMEECWHQWTGIPLASALTAPELAEEVLSRELSRQDPREIRASSWEDLFHQIFLSHVEPQLPRDQPVAITRYPAGIPTLARTIPGTPWADRWELYLGGIETANCYGEETDPAVIRQFMEAQQRAKGENRRRQGRSDPHFLQHPHTLPRCSGVALGADRLIMHILQADHINRVISFPFFQ